MLLLVDIINSMIQAIIFSYSIEYCVKNENKIDRSKMFIMAVILFLINSIFTSIFGNLSICVFIIHILILGAITVLYKDYKIKAIIPYTLVYCFISVNAIIFSNLFFGIIENILIEKYIHIAQTLIIYIPQFILELVIIKYMDKLVQLYKTIIVDNINMTATIIISFCLDFVITSYLIIYNDESKMLRNLTITILCVFFIFIVKYFINIKKKSDQILKLNKVLEEKNNELRKIKHDYGAQISYLYGLCLMDRISDLKKALKDIINKNQTTSTAVDVAGDKNSILYLALKPAVENGIHVIVEEMYDCSSLTISEMELYRIISNIVNNGIRAMNGRGIMIAKIHQYIDNVVISIQNNGPKILEEDLDNIFNAGFTTKDDTDKNHGYGLSIVKDLVESYEGKISVKSTDTVTEFKIIFPIKNDI